MRNILFVFILVRATLALSAATPAKEWQELREQAARTKTAAAYLDVCDYYVNNFPAPYASLKVYFDSAHWAAVKEKSPLSLGRYYSTYANYYYYQDTLSLFRSYKLKALSLYKQIDSYEDMATCYSDLGLYYNCIGNTKAERGYLRKGLSILEEHKLENSDFTVMLSNMSISYLYDAMFPQAMQYARKAYQHATAQKDTAMMIEAVNTQGVIYRKQSQIDECVKKYEEALHLCEATGMIRRFPVIYLNISVAYSECSRHKEAVFFADKARSAALKVNDSRTLCKLYTIYRNSLKAEGKYEAAADSTKKGLSYALRIQRPSDCLEAYMSLATIYSHINKLDSATLYLNKAETLVGEQGKNLLLEDYYSKKGSVYVKMNRFREAIPLFLKALDSSREGNKHIDMEVLYHNISRCYAKLGEHKNAYLYLDSSYNAKEKVYNADMQERLSNLSVKYKTQEKELKIRQLTQAKLEQETQNIQRRNQFLIILIILVFLLGILAYYLQGLKLKNIRLANEAREEERKFQILQKETEARLTRKYIDGLEGERKRLAKELHDGVCSDLLGLQMMFSSAASLTPDFKERFLSLLQKTGKDIRDISHELMPPAFQYATIDEILSDYIFHLNGAIPSLDISYQSSKEADWGCVPAAIGYELYRIVQETLHNIYKHADTPYAKVNLTLEKETLILKIIHGNTGKQFASKGEGIGLRTIHERVQSMNGELEWIQTEKTRGILIWLHLPAKEV